LVTSSRQTDSRTERGFAKASPQQKILHVLIEAWRTDECHSRVPGVRRDELRRRAHLSKAIFTEVIGLLERDGAITDLDPWTGPHTEVYRLTDAKANELGLIGGSG